MKLKNVPNIISAFRILLVPVFIFVYFADAHYVKGFAIGVYALAAITDFLDGAIARRYNLISNLGKVLDPLGDKMMMVAAMICITIDGFLPVWAVSVVVIKELLMGIGGFVIHRRVKAEIPPSNIFGKTTTVVFIVVCLTLMAFPDIPPTYATAMVGVALGLMFAALLSYILMFSAMMKKKNNS
ncbi:MAG: CDP-alcohol phosphatidyltransferase family protein [Oscillospiraceae bacterium]|jgi:CDP-diacylglycerol--glycerol-3-phosphate 3-phosphatidyltransferase|nr:CDP-alcohol phosphatidyltransferase family protein [Oscillospiraceae bacterium]